MMIHHLLFTIFSLLSTLSWTSTGFTLKLTHRDSHFSPLYQSNLSHIERFMKNIHISKARASYLEHPSGVMDALSIRLQSILREPLFTVEIGIGTPAVKKTLIFDTGSDLTWTQCAPCTKCFKQNEPLFIRKKSKTYKALTKKHPLAKSKSFKCGFFGECSYRNRYYSGQSIEGIAATESFTFDTNATVPNLVFGCGTNSFGTFLPQMSGILGLDRRPTSFAMQLGSVIKGRFSYCMSPHNNERTYVKFGDDAVIKGMNAQNTPFQTTSLVYSLNLNDLTINGKKLGLKPTAFGNKCLIDSGSSISLINKSAFSAVRYFLENYFSQFNVRPYVGNKVPKKGLICYTETTKISRFPSLTFNFEGANFNVPSQYIFMYIDNTTFCLAMAESNDVTILGAYQQRNTRFLYDLKEMKLTFAPEDCSKDTPS